MLPVDGSRLTLADVTGVDRAAFVPATQPPHMSEGISPRVRWFRLRLQRGDSQGSWALHYTYKITRIDAFVLGRHAVQHVAGGFDLARHDGALVPGLLVLPENALHGDPIYLRVAGVIDPRDLTIEPVSREMPTALSRRVLFGAFIGFYLGIGAFYLLMFLSLRERSFLHYTIVLALLAFDLIISFGTFFQVLPPITFLQRELLFDTVAMAYIVAMALFTIAFLRLSTRDRIAFWTVCACTVSTFSVLAVDFVVNATLDWWVTFVATLLFYGSLGLASVRAQRAGLRSAGSFSAAVACMIVGYVLNMIAPRLPHPELTVFANQVGTILGSLLLAIALADRIRTTETLAVRDALTGVLNRRAFDDALSSAAAHTGARSPSTGVVIIDIDHFKTYNDDFGHLEGDATLMKVARACASCLRSRDIFARYGGDEFAAIIPEASALDLQLIANRMCEAVLQLRLLQKNGEPVSISVGAALAASGPGTHPSDLLKIADDNLYHAKQSGRNRAVLA